MQLLPLAIIAIFAFGAYTLMKAWSTDGIVHRAHSLLLRAKNGAPDAANLLAACCAECKRAAARNPHDVYISKIWGAALWWLARMSRFAAPEARAHARRVNLADHAGGH